eukprot:8738732-Alexandrium_andersonii.AAC.1
MSASLVGSEMCIRDSYDDTGKYPDQPRRSPTATKTPDLDVHARHQGGACLLYTSDAADDM